MMKAATIQRALDAVAAISAADLVKAEHAQREANMAASAAREARARAGLGPTNTLKRIMAAQLKPHRIEWAEYPQACISLNGIDHTTHVWLGGKVYPATKARRFALHMRTVLTFDMHPKDAAEFIQQVCLLDAAADAIQAAGY